MLRCKQVATMIGRGELEDAGPWLRLKIRLHLLMCRHCARYAAQVSAIGVSLRERFRPAKVPPDLDDLQSRILKTANKSQK